MCKSPVEVEIQTCSLKLFFLLPESNSSVFQLERGICCYIKEEQIGQYIPTAQAAAESIAKSVKKARQKVIGVTPYLAPTARLGMNGVRSSSL